MESMRGKFDIIIFNPVSGKLKVIEKKAICGH
jgi:hypothetical protein